MLSACTSRSLSLAAFAIIVAFFSAPASSLAQSCNQEIPNGLKNSGASIIDNGNKVVNHPHWPVTNDVQQPKIATQGYQNNGTQVDPNNALQSQVVPPAITQLLQTIPIFGALFGALGTQSNGQAGSMGGGSDNKGCDAVGGCTNVNYGCDSTAPPKNSWYDSSHPA